MKAAGDLRRSVFLRVFSGRKYNTGDACCAAQQMVKSSEKQEQTQVRNAVLMMNYGAMQYANARQGR